MRRARLLHVEDDETVVALVRRLVEDRYDITSAGTLSEGIVQASGARNGDRFDAVLYDLTLPDTRASVTDGLEEMIRAASPTPVVVLTGHDDERVIHACLSLGAHSIIRKPANRMAVRDRLLEAEYEMRRQRADEALVARLSSTIRAMTPALPAVGVGGAG